MSINIKKIAKRSSKKVAKKASEKIDNIFTAKKTQSNIIHYLLGGFLFVILALVLAIAYIGSQAESIPTQTEISNASPAVDSVYISNSANGEVDDYSGGTIVPVSGDVKTLHINGVVSDANGTEDISTTTMVFYRSGASGGASCSADNNDCYKVSTCVFSADTDTTKKYNCQISIQYYTDSTDAGGRFQNENWVVDVKVYDLSSSSGSNNSVTKEMGTILSLNIPTTINYGSFGLGDQTTNANNKEMEIAQTGNDEADVQVSGTVMDCTGSNSDIPIGNQKWSLVDVGYASGSTTPLTGASDNTFLNVGYRDNDATNVTKTLYWNIGIPSVGVKGDCTGSNTITVITHVNEGYLLDYAVNNVDYTSISNNGTTDASGRFIYATGETVTFKIGSTTLGSISVVPTDGKLTVPDLVGVARDNNTDSAVLKIARFLQSLDDDNDPSNGITITNTVKTALASVTLDLQTATVNDINTAVVDLGKTLVSEASAQDHIHDTYIFVSGGNKLAGYAWGEQTGYISFNCSNNSSCATASYGVAKNTADELSGYAWSELTGWISFKGSNYGVTVGTSSLSGYAWSETTGWISFNCANDNSCGTTNYSVTIDQGTGVLDGYAWSEQAGYIHMKGSGYGVLLVQ
jgi:hypothetical protein